MDVNTNSQPVHLFFKQDDLDKNVMNKDDASTAYIIFQNNTIQAKYTTLLRDHENVKNERDVLEEDNDRLQKSKICLQGYVKNEYIRAGCYKGLLRVHKEANKCRHKMILVGNLAAITYGMLSLLTFTMYVKITIFVGVSSAHAVIFYKQFMKARSLLEKGTLKEYTKEISEIERSSKLLEDLVDNF